MDRELIKGNFRSAILLLLVVLISLVPVRYSNAFYAYFPSIMVSAMTLASLLSVLLIRRGVGFSKDYAEVECRRGESVALCLRVENNSFFICPKASAYLYVTDLFQQQDTVTPATFTLAAKSRSEFSFSILMNHVGEYKAGIRSVELYDFLGLFRFRVEGKKELTILVLPQDQSTGELELNEKMLTENHNQKKSMVSDGFDYTGVREYALGDSMKRIHWKLSAHSLNYMTKITETSVRNDVSVILDMSAPAYDAEMLACIYDALIEYGLSFARQAAAIDTEYNVLFPGRDGQVHRIIPKSKEEERVLVSQMAVISPKKSGCFLDGAQMVREERASRSASSNLILCTANMTDMLAQEILAVKQQGRNPIVLYVIPAETGRREEESFTKPMRIFEDYGITYSVVSVGSMR